MANTRIANPVGAVTNWLRFVILSPVSESCSETLVNRGTLN